jgi:hypothetical protein
MLLHHCMTVAGRSSATGFGVQVGVASRLFEVVQPSTDVSMQSALGEGLSSAVCILVCVGMSGDDAETMQGESLTKALSRRDAIPGLLCQVYLKSLEANGFGRCYFWDNEQSMMVSTPFEGTLQISDKDTGH